MSEENNYHESSSAVRAHLVILQNVIQRMSSNSASTKAWCITLVSAILVIMADKGKSEYAWIAVIPIALFLALDAYYLALEKSFRYSYDAFIDKLHIRQVEVSDLYSVLPGGTFINQLALAYVSFSIWPFYLALSGMVYLCGKFIF